MRGKFYDGGRAGEHYLNLESKNIKNLITKNQGAVGRALEFVREKIIE